MSESKSERRSTSDNPPYKRQRSRLKSTKSKDCKLPDEKKTKDADKLITEEVAEVGNVSSSV